MGARSPELVSVAVWLVRHIVLCIVVSVVTMKLY